MARFKSTDTRAEVALRRALRSQGMTGYRLHFRHLPGRPDIAFTRWRLAVFVDGEFWHGHPDVFRFGTKGAYWDQKIRRNQARDETASAKLARASWTVLRLWDRDVRRDPTVAANRVADALRAAGHPGAVTMPTERAY